MKECRTIFVNDYASELKLNNEIKKVTDQGFGLIKVAYQGNVLMFEKEIPQVKNTIDNGNPEVKNDRYN